MALTSNGEYGNIISLMDAILTKVHAIYFFKVLEPTQDTVL